MTELRKRMIREHAPAGPVEGTEREYLRRSPTGRLRYDLPDQLTERKVEDYILHVREDLGVAKGDFDPIWAGRLSSSTSIRSAMNGPCSSKKVRKPRRKRLRPSAVTRTVAA